MSYGPNGTHIDTTLDGPLFLTEELAELHVIIQAIGWERKKAGAESVAVVERATV